MKVIPLILGQHETGCEEEHGVCLNPHTGSVTLIDTGTKKILVETGGRGTWKMLVAALKKEKLLPHDIDTIILTHFHLDHCFNIAHFPQAQIIGWKHEWRDISTLRLHDISKLELAPGVSIFPTPGHAEEHISVLVKGTPEGDIVIAGDAINAKYMKTRKIEAFAYDEALYIKSAENILMLADQIIPGHGEVIQV
jgi:N-acyl homoserine lactone hydrolase